MIPLIAYIPRFTLIVVSLSLLTAELHKSHYFPVLFGVSMLVNWPTCIYV